MRRKYKLIIIILLSAVFTYLIYILNKETKINILSLGDGVSYGETSFNIKGFSYNDYITKHFETLKVLKNYTNLSKKNLTLEELLFEIKDNKYYDNEKKYIKELMHNSNLITISIGEEELTKKAITKDLNKETIKKYINLYENLISLIKENTDSKIVVISYYENNYLNKTNTILLNSELSNLCIKHNLIFINISDILKENDNKLESNSLYFNYQVHKQIAEMIINSI